MSANDPDKPERHASAILAGAVPLLWWLLTEQFGMRLPNEIAVIALVVTIAAVLWAIWLYLKVFRAWALRIGLWGRVRTWWQESVLALEVVVIVFLGGWGFASTYEPPIDIPALERQTQIEEQQYLRTIQTLDALSSEFEAFRQRYRDYCFRRDVPLSAVDEQRFVSAIREAERFIEAEHGHRWNIFSSPTLGAENAHQPWNELDLVVPPEGVSFAEDNAKQRMCVSFYDRHLYSLLQYESLYTAMVESWMGAGMNLSIKRWEAENGGQATGP